MHEHQRMRSATPCGPRRRGSTRTAGPRTGRAAAAGRKRRLGRSGMLGLQRSVGNAGVDLVWRRSARRSTT